MVIFVTSYFIVEQRRHTVSNILITTDSNIFFTNADLLLIILNEHFWIKFYLKCKVFFQENAIEKVVCRM